MPKNADSEYKPEVIAKYTDSTKAPFKCKHCEFTSATLGGVIMHTNRKHNPKSTNWGKGKRGPAPAPGSKWGLGGSDDTEQADESRTPTGRPRKKRQTAGAIVWRLCPCCGFNIELAAQAYAAAQSFKD